MYNAKIELMKHKQVIDNIYERQMIRQSQIGNRRHKVRSVLKGLKMIIEEVKTKYVSLSNYNQRER